MLDKQTGLVPCAHCSKRQSVKRCSLCGRMACEACADDHLTCPEPHPRRFSLPRGARALDVDAAGVWLLCSNRDGLCRHLALSVGELVAFPGVRTGAIRRLQRGVALSPMLVLRDGSCLSVASFRSSVVALRLLLPRLTSVELLQRNLRYGWIPWLFMGDLLRYAFLVRGPIVEVVDLRRGPAYVMAFKALDLFQVAASRDAVGQLAVGIGPMVQLMGRRAGRGRLEGRIAWMQFDAAGELLTATVEAQHRSLTVHRVVQPRLRDQLEARVIFRDPSVAVDLWSPAHASATRDGRLLAVRSAQTATVHVLDLRRGDHTTLAPYRGAELQPSGAVELVRFVDHDRRLVVATELGEVVVWHVRNGQVFNPA